MSRFEPISPNPRRVPVPALARTLGALLAASVTFNCFFAGALPAHADALDSDHLALEVEAERVQTSLEFVDSSIAKAAGDLVVYQGRLPGAQQTLLEAQGRVTSMAKEIEALTAKVEFARQNKAKIAAQLESDEQQIKDAKRSIGRIASHAYKSGGVPASLAMLLGSSNSVGSLKSMELASHAMRSQNAVLTTMTQHAATNANSRTRLSAVEEEIRDLKKEKDAAFAREKSVRDDAAGKRAEVNKLIDDTTRLNARLQAAKPGIKANLARVKAEQDTVAAEIAERDRKLREAWEAEQRRVAAETAKGRPAPGSPPYAPPATGSPSVFGLRHPFAGGAPISSGFGWRVTPPGTIDFNGTGGYMHTGIDFGVACGTPVYASASGTVFSSGWNSADGGGWRVKLSHGVVQGNSLTTVYYHNSSIVVQNGQQVSQGQLIAYSGSTGNSTGCHAHFETWLNGAAVDPMTLL